MALRLGVIVPRVFVVVVVALLATATITFAADTRGGPAAPAHPQTTPQKVLLVPDVRGQAYVFAKSTLEEAGFAWRVTGSVQGYASNLVSGQSPAPGSRVYDTGAPAIALSLRLNPRYPQAGTPENTSPFDTTPLRLVGGSAPKAKPKAKPKVKAKPKAKPKVKAKPKAKHVVKPKAKPKPKPKPKPKAKPKPKHEPKPKPAPKAARPPAFSVPGAKPEPLDEIPLPARAKRLDAWVSAHQSPTDATVSYWLYQHSWVVTGARLGWWHGAQALELLIQVDRKVQRLWGIGARSERLARAALGNVRRRSR
jgi:hypothetical protein